MILYHATKASLKLGEQLVTPNNTECMDVLSGGVIYLTSNPDACKRYGDVYEIDVAEAISYKKQREIQGLSKKKGRYTRDVYVALPSNTKILRRLEN